MKFSFPVRAIALAALTTTAFADVRLPAIFGDHMVLQREGSAPVWGTADPGEQVTVTAGSATGQAVAGPDGKWLVRLSGLAASDQPIDVTVAGKNQIVFHDVLVGDVWLCSGQSNMEFGIKLDSSAAEEIPKANHPTIRFFQVPHANVTSPAADIAPSKAGLTEGTWMVCTPESVVLNGWNGFSAVSYFFGRDVQAVTNAPVGLIGTYWGGTVAQAWTSLEALQAVPAFKSYVNDANNRRQNEAKQNQDYQDALLKWQNSIDQWKIDNKATLDAFQAAVQDWNQKAKQARTAGTSLPPKPKDPSPQKPNDPSANPNVSTLLYNGMISPLIPYGIKGAIWYQGESNANRPVQYATLLPTMIQDWRTRWGQGDFPFLIVQIASYQAVQPNPSESDLAVLRESQAKTLSLPNTGLALAIDIGDPYDIHPKDKDDVGARLALAARKVAYGDAAVVASGPVFQSRTVEDGKIRVTFTSVGQGLALGAPPAHFHPGQPRPDAPAVLKGFAVAGADGKFAWADAVIDGDTVVVSSAAVPQPQEVRYAWADNPVANLYNKDGLPAVPFRSDTFPVGEDAPKK